MNWIIQKKEIYRMFLILSIFLIPFDGLIILKVSSQGYIYPIFACVVLSIFLTKGQNYLVDIPGNLSFKLLLVFILYIFFSVVFHISMMLYQNFKGIYGIERFLYQNFSAWFFVILSVALYNIMKKQKDLFALFFDFIHKSFYLIVVYTIIEFLAWNGNPIASDIILGLDSYIQSGDLAKSGMGILRIRGVSAEASYFSMYLCFIFPWIVGRHMVKGNKYFVGEVVYWFLLLIFTFSRTAYLIFFIELIVFVLLFWESIKWKIIKFKIIFIMMSLAILFIGFYMRENVKDYLYAGFMFSLDNNDTTDPSLSFSYVTSNITRIGSVVTALNIFRDYPLFGIGWGQYGFYMASYVPDWAKISPEIVEYLSNDFQSTWPFIHNLYARFLCETGIVGFLLWCSIWGVLIYQIIRIISIVSEKEKVIVKCILISLVTTLLTGFNVETFRIGEYWYVISLSWIAIEKVERCEKIYG